MGYIFGKVRTAFRRVRNIFPCMRKPDVFSHTSSSEVKKKKPRRPHGERLRLGSHSLSHSDGDKYPPMNTRKFKNLPMIIVVAYHKSLCDKLWDPSLTPSPFVESSVTGPLDDAVIPDIPAKTEKKKPKPKPATRESGATGAVDNAVMPYTPAEAKKKPRYMRQDPLLESGVTGAPDDAVIPHTPAEAKKPWYINEDAFRESGATGGGGLEDAEDSYTQYERKLHHNRTLKLKEGTKKGRRI